MKQIIAAVLSVGLIGGSLLVMGAPWQVPVGVGMLTVGIALLVFVVLQ